jgi:ubiquinone/menaquinone biosynthesis C-methylase UbiE
MIEKAKRTLGERGFLFEKIDFHKIPYPDKTFDIIISNHNLYHALDLDEVLGEINRVLKDDGVFYATTNSHRHLASLWELIGLPDARAWPKSFLPTPFDSETGLEVLSRCFQDVERRYYHNTLHITEFAPILSYFSSVQDEHIQRTLEQSAIEIREKFDAAVRQSGYFKTGNEACLFICRKEER